MFKNYSKLIGNHRFFTSTFDFVPKHQPVCESDVKILDDFLRSHNKILVLTGAGISTESGIPDYRSAGVGLYARSNHKPIQFPDFLKSADVRKRYWARNFVGWPRFSQRQPNATHLMVRDLEVQHGKVQTVVTQNVDRLHHKAGSQNVIELHGHGYEVMCLGCSHVIGRHDFQKTLTVLNPEMKETSNHIRPDGDVDLSEVQIRNFQLPSCEKCGGILKPDIIFFGDNLPRKRVNDVNHSIENSDSLLVLGSSLAVFSAYRIALLATDYKIPIAIVNIGETRGDDLASIKISAKCGEILPKMLQS